MIKAGHAIGAFIAATTALAGGDALAQCGGNSCANVKVERLYVRNAPEIYVSTTGDESELNCQPIEDRYIELRPSHPHSDKIYSMLLSAKLADHDIWIRVREAPNSGCSILYTVLQ